MRPSNLVCIRWLSWSGTSGEKTTARDEDRAGKERTEQREVDKCGARQRERTAESLTGQMMRRAVDPAEELLTLQQL